ncbi:MAG: hypothetical protein HC765_08065 [Brachymonas sp.]|nr:hypothetical protein [Brachymonas sp.]
MHGSKFTLTTTGGGTSKVAVALTRNSSGIVKTSDLSINTGNEAGDSIYLLNGMYTTTLDIDDGFGTSNLISRTLNNTGGNIRVTAPNVEFSGTGSLTLKASSNTSFETISTIAAGHTVTIAGVQNATIAAGSGWLQGGGTLDIANAGSTLIVNGTISPGSGAALGTLTIVGNLTMAALACWICKSARMPPTVIASP